MKKIFALAAALVCIAPTQAQIMKSTTFTEKIVKSDITWYVKAGLSFNNFTGPGMSDAKDEIKAEENEGGFSGGFGAQLGYDFEFGFQKPFSKYDFYWGMQLGFGTRGGHYKGNAFVDEYSGYVEEESFRFKMDAYTFKLTPIQIGYKFPLTSDFKIDAHVGAFISVDMAGKIKEEEEYSRIYDNGREPLYDFNSESFGYGNDYYKMYRFDAGLQLGIGFWYRNFLLDFTWQRGFCDMWKADYEGAKGFQSSNAILSLGYAF